MLDGHAFPLSVRVTEWFKQCPYYTEGARLIRFPEQASSTHVSRGWAYEFKGRAFIDSLPYQ